MSQLSNNQIKPESSTPQLESMMVIRFFLLVMLFLGISCTNKEPEIAFYHWKSNYKTDSLSTQLCHDLAVKQLFVHVFDVDWSNEISAPELKSRLNKLTPFPDNIEIVPVVYLTRRAVLNSDPGQLVPAIVDESEKILGISKIKWKSFHWDCDWNDATRKGFFSILETAKQIMPGTEQVSTIRLSQVKYPSKSGVPPVNRVVLMFYNVGEFRQLSELNSILNYSSAEPYLKSISAYPLPMDLALPAFQWGIHYRLGEVQGIVSETELPELCADSSWKIMGDTLFQAKSGFFKSGRYFKAGDMLKIEKTNLADCKQAAEWIKPHWKTDNFTLIFYHLNSPVVYAHSAESFRAVSAVFR